MYWTLGVKLTGLKSGIIENPSRALWYCEAKTAWSPALKPATSLIDARAAGAAATPATAKRSIARRSLVIVSLPLSSQLGPADEVPHDRLAARGVDGEVRALVLARAAVHQRRPRRAVRGDDHVHEVAGVPAADVAAVALPQRVGLRVVDAGRVERRVHRQRVGGGDD